LIKYITYFFEFLPFLFWLLNYKKIKTIEKRVFLLYTALVSLLILIGIIVLNYFESVTTYYLIARIYDTIEYTLLSIFFSAHTKNGYVKKIILLSIIPFIVFCVFDHYYSDKNSYAFLPLVVECLILMTALIFIFYEKMTHSFDIPLYQTSFFWISVAFIVYFAGNFFLFLYSKNSFNDESFKNQYTIIYTTFTILKDILLCIAATIKERDNTNKLNSNSPIFLNIDLP
jgi:hypothetical protein